MPIELVLVLGRIMEPALTRTSQMSGGDLTVFFSRPISTAFLIAAVLIVVVPALWILRKRRAEQSIDATTADS
jgi:putative tricarboxylic transport membrane protein